MIYCDAVESTIVGSQRHSLLRKVELERKGEERATIEINIWKLLKCRWLHRMVPCWSYPPAKPLPPLGSNKYKRDRVL